MSMRFTSLRKAIFGQPEVAVVGLIPRGGAVERSSSEALTAQHKQLIAVAVGLIVLLVSVPMAALLLVVCCPSALRLHLNQAPGFPQFTDQWNRWHYPCPPWEKLT